MPEIIKPTFTLTAADIADKIIVAVNGSAGYETRIVTGNILFSLTSRSKIAIAGNNGSGKTTLLKAIMNFPEVIKSGQWHAPKPCDIGYLDQHYSTLDSEFSVLESVIKLVPHWTHAEIRKHLNDFLFRKNEEVNALTSTLSGGEKARLSLALIGAKTPKLLILDEVTNNLDLETKAHIVEVLKEYPGAIIAVSHDEDFLEEIGIEDRIEMIYHSQR
jgi:ATPase subunit of ABC transporter with duplicated ATPase domains